MNFWENSSKLNCTGRMRFRCATLKIQETLRENVWHNTMHGNKKSKCYSPMMPAQIRKCKVRKWRGHSNWVYVSFTINKDARGSSWCNLNNIHHFFPLTFVSFFYDCLKDNCFTQRATQLVSTDAFVAWHSNHFTGYTHMKILLTDTNIVQL